MSISIRVLPLVVIIILSSFQSTFCAPSNIRLPKLICSLPPVLNDNNNCEAYMPMWTFNSKLGLCEKFIYGGCNGTENLFREQHDCIKMCAGDE